MHTQILPAEALAAPPGNDEAVDELHLLRATTLRMVRLQLALERQDRRTALQMVDELLDLDRDVEQQVAEQWGDSLGAAFLPDLNHQRAAINREKLALAAQVINRAKSGSGDTPGQASSLPVRQISSNLFPMDTNAATASHGSAPAQEAAEEEADDRHEIQSAALPSRRGAIWALTLVALILCSVVVAVYLYWAQIGLSRIQLGGAPI